MMIQRGLSMDELHNIFSEFDTSGDNQLDWGEFKGALKKLGVNVPVSKMRQLFSMFDEDETGEVDYNEFCRLIYPNLDMDVEVPEGAMEAAMEGQDPPPSPPADGSMPTPLSSGLSSAARSSSPNGTLPQRPSTSGGGVCSKKWKKLQKASGVEEGGGGGGGGGALGLGGIDPAASGFAGLLGQTLVAQKNAACSLPPLPGQANGNGSVMERLAALRAAKQQGASSPGSMVVDKEEAEAATRVQSIYRGKKGRESKESLEKAEKEEKE